MWLAIKNYLFFKKTAMKEGQNNDTFLVNVEASYYWFSQYWFPPYISANIKKNDSLPSKEDLLNGMTALDRKRPVFINTADSFCWSPSDIKHITRIAPHTMKKIQLNYSFYLSSLNSNWVIGVARYSAPSDEKEN